MKIGLLQCNVTSNDIKHNAKLILDALRKAASAGAELCVSSELALSGCPASNQLLRESFTDYCRGILEEMAEILVKEKLPPLLLGAPIANPVPQGKPQHNCAVLLQDGRVMVIARKVLLPSDGTHDDYRYFEPGVACGVVQYNGWRMGVCIGEDIWNDRAFWKDRRQFDSDPVEEFMVGGADALINLTAIPYCVGGQELHRRMLAWSASKYRVPIIMVNQVGGQDSTIYPGSSMLLNSGGVVCRQAASFREDVMVIDLDKDVKAECSVPQSADHNADTCNALELGVRDFVRKSGFSKVVLGLSGGIDSALVAAIAVRALGSENVFGVLMPSPHSSEGSVTDSLALAKNLGIETQTIPIEPAMRAYENMLADAFAETRPDTTEENIQSRIRSNILMAFSNKFSYMLMNTGNKSEAAVGYATLYGDLSGALCVIGDLYKFQVYELAKWINAQSGKDLIPGSIINKEPSAELKPGQKDSDSLPPYETLDAILQAHIDEGRDYEKLLNDGFDKETVIKVLRMIRRAGFKRRQAPPALYISSHAFGQCGYMPIATTVDF